MAMRKQFQLSATPSGSFCQVTSVTNSDPADFRSCEWKRARLKNRVSSQPVAGSEEKSNQTVNKMKTSHSQSYQSSPPKTSRFSYSIPVGFLRFLLFIFCFLLGRSASLGQSNIVGFVSTATGQVANYGAKCDAAHPIQIWALANSGCLAFSPWTITLTDAHTPTPNSMSQGSLTSLGGQLRTAGGAVPTFDLTTLDVGTATLTITDPCGKNYSFGFNVVDCSGGAALIPYLGFMNLIGPNRAVTYVVQVANVGTVASSLTTLEITGILPTSDCTVTSSGMTVANFGSSQKVSVSVPPINPNDQLAFTFEMQATASAVIGSTFPITATLALPNLYTDTRPIKVVASIDPNAKYGPPGYGPLHTIQKNTVLPYLITFENDPSALAPAQIVIITDYLDTTKVEPVSLEFGTVHFGNKTVTPPSGVNPFSVTVPYDVDNDPLTTADNIFVRVSGSVDQNQFSGTYGKVEWMFESLDAPGGNPPPINIGFLPPNNIQPEGDGGVTFTVAQKANLAPGTLITNIASIVFDVNAPILTPVWTNRIVVPSTLAISRVNPNKVRVAWTGGVLEQSSTANNGIWTNSPVQISPWTFNSTAPQKFFRVRNN